MASMQGMNSIIQQKRECYICHTTIGLERHHCIHGTANRKHSEEYGLTVWLCHRHHRQLHDWDVALDRYLCQTAQKVFEERYGHDKFMEIFKRNWPNFTKQFPSWRS